MINILIFEIRKQKLIRILFGLKIEILRQQMLLITSCVVVLKLGLFLHHVQYGYMNRT